MDNSTSDGNEDVSWQTIADSLIYLRDALVDNSLALRDLLFEMNPPSREEANKIAKQILNSLKR
jgi:hypothetical protein